jgi:phosphohistidine phosphatase SixA
VWPAFRPPVADVTVTRCARLVYSSRSVKPIALALALTLATASAASAQEAIYLVRHAEREDSSADSRLSAAGEARANRLAEWLRTARITHVYTTDLRRTIQTAMPFAAASHLAPEELPAADTQAVRERVAGLGPADRALIVGHSNTLPEIIRALGVTAPITIPDAEFDNIFIIVPRKDAEPVLLRFKY